MFVHPIDFLLHFPRFSLISLCAFARARFILFPLDFFFLNWSLTFTVCVSLSFLKNLFFSPLPRCLTYFQLSNRFLFGFIFLILSPPKDTKCFDIFQTNCKYVLQKRIQLFSTFAFLRKPFGSQLLILLSQLLSLFQKFCHLDHKT